MQGGQCDNVTLDGGPQNRHVRRHRRSESYEWIEAVPDSDRPARLVRED
jgi:hypothetical protein